MFKKLFGFSNEGGANTTEDRVEKARKDVDQALGMFVVAGEKISKANTEIAQAIAEDEAEIQRKQESITKAKGHLEHNNRVRARLSEFIPEEGN